MESASQMCTAIGQRGDVGLGFEWAYKLLIGTVTWPMNASEARGVSHLIQTSLFSFMKCQLVSPRT